MQMVRDFGNGSQRSDWLECTSQGFVPERMLLDALKLSESLTIRLKMAPELFEPTLPHEAPPPTTPLFDLVALVDSLPKNLTLVSNNGDLKVNRELFFIAFPKYRPTLKYNFLVLACDIEVVRLV